MTALVARRVRGLRPRRGAGETERAVALVRVLLLFESAMYSALTPLLPHYEHLLHATKPAVGLLTASYPAGIVPGSLLGAWVVARLGVRRATVVGLVLLAAAVAAFGFCTDIVLLDALRFLQGIGCGFIWVGGLTWVIGSSAKHNRGRTLASVFAAAIVGTILGPILGTVAMSIGTATTFALVGAVSAILAGWTRRHPAPPAQESEERPTVRSLLANRGLGLGAWLIVLEAATVGATSTLIPLRISRLGGSGALIGATFVVGSLLSAVLAQPVGRATDRRGPRAPLWLCLPATASLLALLTLPTSPLALALVTAVVYGGPLTLYTVPATTILTDASERAGIPIVVASMVMNLGWAFGEALGAPFAANLSQLGGDALPLLGLAAVMLATLWPVTRARMPGPVAGASGADAGAAGTSAADAGAAGASAAPALDAGVAAPAAHQPQTHARDPQAAVCR